MKLYLKIDDIIQAVEVATGVIVLPGKSEQEAKARARALINNKACRHVLDQITATELFLPENFQISGIKFKGALDAKGNRIIADIKNMPDATLQKAIDFMPRRFTFLCGPAYVRRNMETVFKLVRLQY